MDIWTEVIDWRVVSARDIHSSFTYCFKTKKPRLNQIRRYLVIENSVYFCIFFFLYLETKLGFFDILFFGYRPIPLHMQIFKSPTLLEVPLHCGQSVRPR